MHILHNNLFFLFFKDECKSHLHLIQKLKAQLRQAGDCRLQCSMIKCLAAFATFATCGRTLQNVPASFS